jgi:hypothetical protein
MNTVGAKWNVEDCKARCDFASDGRIENGSFKPIEAFPTLARDGGTLVITAQGPRRG